jgi:hypothetical protein
MVFAIILVHFVFRQVYRLLSSGGYCEHLNNELRKFEHPSFETYSLHAPEQKCWSRCTGDAMHLVHRQNDIYFGTKEVAIYGRLCWNGNLRFGYNCCHGHTK